MSRKGLLLFAAMCVIWGIPYLLIRVAVRDVTPATLVCSRTALGGLILLPMAMSNGGFRVLLPYWRPLLVFIVVELAVPWLLLSDAETRLSSSLSGLLVAAVPLVAALLARFTGDRVRVDLLGIAGLLMGFGGVAALVGLDLGQLDVAAVVEVGVVVVGYAIGPIVQSRYLADLPSYSVVAASLLIVAVAYLPVAVIQAPHHLHLRPALAILVLGTVCTALAFVIFFALIGDVGPSRAVLITYVSPAVAVAAGVIWLDERFTIGMAVGFPLILLGSVLAARRPAAGPPGRRARRGRHEPDPASPLSHESAPT